jgi:hypothetical protein
MALMRPQKCTANGVITASSSRLRVLQQSNLRQSTLSK